MSNKRLILSIKNKHLLEALNLLYSNTMNVIGNASSGKELVRFLNESYADYVLLDDQIKDLAIHHIIPVLKTMHPNIKVIIVSDKNSQLNSEQMLKAGAWCYVSKYNLSVETVQNIIENKEITNASYNDVVFFNNALSNSKKVLVVDNFHISNEIVSEYLIASGFKVLTAKNGKEAYKILKNNTIDLIISDYNMPGMDGLQLAKAVYNDKEMSQIPMVILSSLATKDLIEKAKQYSVKSWIRKPINKSKFNTILSNLTN